MKILEMLNPISMMLQATYSKKLWRTIYDSFSKTYVTMLFALSTQYEPIELGKFSDKIQQDNSFLAEVFSSKLGPREMTENTEFIQNFELCLTDKIEEVIVHLVKISKKLKDEFNENCIVTQA